jgi:hypothetical protein
VGVSLILSSVARSRVSPKLYLHNSALARSLPLKVNLFFALPKDWAYERHELVRILDLALIENSPKTPVTCLSVSLDVFLCLPMYIGQFLDNF